MGLPSALGVNALTSTTDPGFDFSPVGDRLRLVDRSDINFRVDVDILAPSTDTSLSPGSDVVALAYTNNVAGATVTTLYGIDSVAATLVRIGGPDGVPSPNAGAVTTIGPLGITPGTDDVSFDIAPLRARPTRPGRQLGGFGDSTRSISRPGRLPKWASWGMAAGSLGSRSFHEEWSVTQSYSKQSTTPNYKL